MKQLFFLAPCTALVFSLHTHAAYQDRFYPSPLMIAIHKGCPETVKLLIDNGADIKIRTPTYEPITFYTTMIPRKNTLAILELLLQAGADINVEGWPPLLCPVACTKRKNREIFPIVARLITAGAIKTTGSALTPLHEIAHNEARRKFVEAIPGRNLQERIMLALVLHMCSADTALRASAEEQAQKILSLPLYAWQLSKFLPLDA